jgi:hypothetical protein
MCGEFQSKLALDFDIHTMISTKVQDHIIGQVENYKILLFQ